jgi:hypothetical protein
MSIDRYQARATRITAKTFFVGLFTTQIQNAFRKTSFSEVASLFEAGNIRDKEG